MGSDNTDMMFEPAPAAGVEKRPEKERRADIPFYITDHSPDIKYGVGMDDLRETYAAVKAEGISSVRYDWRWEELEKNEGESNAGQLARYEQAKGMMEEVGLDAPTIVLSSIPAGAKELYKTDKEQFFSAYERYVTLVRDSLAAIPGQKVDRIQVLNELNNPVYTPVAAEDLPRLCDITRRIMGEYNGDVKLMATLHAGSLQKLLGTDIREYLPKFREIKDSFDIVAVDCYPGMWHWPVEEAGLGISDVLFARKGSEEIFRQMGLLREVFSELAGWEQEYELGEVGLLTNGPWSGEKKQRFFFDTFFRAFRQMLGEFEREGKKLPSHVGLYEIQDEPTTGALGKLLSLAPWPENTMGLWQADGDRKSIVDDHHRKTGEERESQLSRIIRYVNTPPKQSDKI